MSTESAIPDAPVSGTIHGAPFVARDARYVVDDCIAYEHVDLVLSAGKSEDACGAIEPSHGASVWLRLDRKATIVPEDAPSWSVHYQVFEDDGSGGHWVGLTAKKALFAIHGVGADGHLTGGLAVCFGDDSGSCVSGSFDAASCPARIDQAVRGTPPPESIPKEYLERMLLDGGR